MGFCRPPGSDGTVPVSYTHLDVYKRQVITFLYHIQVTYSKPVPKAEDRLQGATEVHEESKPVSREDIEREEQRKQQQQD